MRFSLFAAYTLFITACTTLPTKQLPDFVALIERTSPTVLAIGDEQGFHGSGFRLANTRQIVTAAHVVSALQGNAYVTWNQQRFSVRLLRSDKDKDLALLELITDAPMPGMELLALEQTIKVGEWIVVLGCPFGARATATIGIVSAEPGAVLEPSAYRSRLQLNAAVNPGNSGGPVVNQAGQVIGIANATIPGGFGLGFAVPVTELKNLLAEH